MATLAQYIDVMVIQLGAKSGKDDNAKPVADGKMSGNAKNPILLKNPNKEQEWHQTLSARGITSSSNICPIATVKSLDSSYNSKIQVELDSHVDTSVVGSDILVVHNH